MYNYDHYFQLIPSGFKPPQPHASSLTDPSPDGQHLMDMLTDSVKSHINFDNDTHINIHGGGVKNGKNHVYKEGFQIRVTIQEKIF